MTTHEVTYRGPASFAVRAAALIADVDGLELTSATRSDDAEGAPDSVVLVMTLEGPDEAVVNGLAAVRAELPPDATVD